MLTKIETIRHSLAHILARAIKEFYPEVKFGIGPDIENGFYYDFSFAKNQNLSLQDLPKIEKKMKQLVKQNIKFIKKQVSTNEAKKIFKNQPYKLELIKDIIIKNKNKKIYIYEFADFIDLCAGPHIKSTKDININAFKLNRIAGAYWKGDKKNPMLTRIYGIAFEDEKKLKDYIIQQEEAKKRDHRILGKKLDLFCFSELVGAGLPLYTPKGTILKDILQDELWQISRKFNVQKVSTPHFAKIKLYEISGHKDKFGDELFHIKDHYNQNFAVKPVQCPHHNQIYASRLRSYRDLPIRYMESGMQYRDEKPGEIGGLTRTRGFTVEDGHTYCEMNQVEKEVKILVNIIKKFYKGFGLWGNHWVSLSVRDYSHPEKYIGEPKDWNKAEKILQKICNDLKLDAKKIEGEAALYGPKIDFMFKDALGNERQLATVQLDFASPKRFNLVYTNKKGKNDFVIMIHRAILGSYERFLALLIEHYAGAFPLWLSPVQISVIPISEKNNKYANEIFKQLNENDFRCELKKENETLGKKIRQAQIEKTPYILIVGDKEQKSKTISVRERSKGDIGTMKLNKFIEQIQKQINDRI
ncbi:MAG: threonine--tRNA ligase [Patescibacteria group bacterium]|nr:threonine--tRNA ligase [Patescibacteria group bacterium]